jgi:phosphoglycolate phosphatase
VALGHRLLRPPLTSAVLLDLDGTLTDPRDGILRSLRHALTGLGAPCPADEALERFIGPPLQESLAEMLGPGRRGEVPRAVALYRERYGESGLFEAEVYPGITELLSSLAADGHRLFVCTSKPTVFAARVVRHFGLDRHLEGVYGSELDGARSDKRELLAHLLSHVGMPAERAVMVGDRKHDVLAARANGVRAIGVTWGYGSAAELRDAGADVLVDDPGDLLAAVVARDPIHR